MTTPRVLLTVEEAAETIGIGRTSMFALIKSGAVESITLGRRRRVSLTALVAYIDRLVAEQSTVTEGSRDDAQTAA